MQNPTLFNIPIKDNLLFSGTPCSDERIKEVVQKTYCNPIFSQVDLGYEHIIHDNGNSFGVYKSRLCIARTILKDSPIYIFDDIFSSYDDNENKTICKNIIDLLPNKSAIFLTNSYSNVKNCDYILKLKKGKVTYFGDSATYNKLQKAGGLNE
jgi:ABC-type multidrug transport system fused ATPase/permease subunit